MRGARAVSRRSGVRGQFVTEPVGQASSRRSNPDDVKNDAGGSSSPPPCGRFIGDAQSADRRQFQRRRGGVDSEVEAEDIELEALAGGEENADKTVERELVAGAARRPSKQGTVRQEILADGIGRQLEA